MAAPRPKASSSQEQEQAGSSEKQVYCWACRALIVVPVQDGRHVQIFKCGWCGAINPQHHAQQPSGPAMDSSASHGPKHDGTWTAFLDRMEDRIANACTCSDGIATAVGWLVVLLVCGIVTAIGTLGVYPILWDLCRSPVVFALHVGVSAALLFNVFFNYGLAVTRSPGRVEEFYDISQRPPQQGTLNDFTYCSKCDKAKPPNAHHCSACGFCIVDMDHHCPFLNNCVGRGNLRHFLLFLFWVTLAMFYALTMLVVSLLHNKRALQRAMRGARSRPVTVASFAREPGLALAVLVRLPAAPFVAILLTVLCAIVLAMVGSLCVRAWKYALDGWLDNLRYVFGSGHPLHWFMPSWSRPQERRKLTKGA